jgi:hypothetical protein
MSNYILREQVVKRASPQQIWDTPSPQGFEVKGQSAPLALLLPGLRPGAPQRGSQPPAEQETGFTKSPYGHPTPPSIHLTRLSNGCSICIVLHIQFVEYSEERR